MMKKRYALFAAALAMMSVAATSCQKEDNGDEPLVSFKAVIDQGHKTHLDDINNDGTWLGVAWDPTDRVMLTNSDGRASEYTIGSITNNVATFNCTNQPTNQNQMTGTFFRAMYPASYVKVQSDGTMILDIPMVQRYAEHSMMGSPCMPNTHAPTVRTCSTRIKMMPLCSDSKTSAASCAFRSRETA